MPPIEQETPDTPEKKDKAIAKAVSEIEKEHGDGSIISMDKKAVKAFPCIPTGIYSLDYRVLGIGGLPRGRIVEVYGPESGGKTTLALMSIASAQRANGRAAFIDAEHSLDPSWSTLLGVNVNDMLISQPDNGEQALSIAEKLILTRAFDIIVVDSVAALVPKAEIDGEIGASNMGLQARLMSQAMRMLAGPVSKSGSVLLLINQIRDKIGVMFGSPETTTGGRALKFYASVRLDVRRIAAVKDGDEFIGNKVRIKAAKNKVSPPFRETEIELLFNKGFDRHGDIFDAAVSRGVVDKSGAWYSFQGERVGQGRSNSIAHMLEHGLIEKLLPLVREKDGV